MKRSDMLLKLQETLVEAPEGVEEAAEYILAHLEKAGMVPPGKFTSSGCMHTVRDMCNCGPGYHEYEWDRE